MDKEVTLLNDDEVLFLRAGRILMANPTFKVSEFLDSLAQMISDREEEWSDSKEGWFSEQGVRCEVLQFGNAGWQRGRVRLRIEFFPEAQEMAPRPKLLQETRRREEPIPAESYNESYAVSGLGSGASDERSVSRVESRDRRPDSRPESRPESRKESREMPLNRDSNRDQNQDSNQDSRDEWDDSWQENRPSNRPDNWQETSQDNWQDRQDGRSDGRSERRPEERTKNRDEAYPPEDDWGEGQAGGNPDEFYSSGMYSTRGEGSRDDIFGRDEGQRARGERGEGRDRQRDRRKEDDYSDFYPLDFDDNF
jgi:hypothetical protein